MAEPRRRARRCVMCGMVNRPSAQSCECGHHFDDDADPRPLLRSRQQTGWVMVIAGLLLTLVTVVLTALVIGLLGFLLITPSLALFVKGTRVVDAARHGLRDLERLPRATLRR